MAVILILICGLEHSVSASKQNKEFGEVKDKNGNVQGFSFSQLMEHADEMPEEIVKVLQHTERWIYTLSEPAFAVGGDTLQVTNVMCMYFSYLAKK